MKKAFFITALILGVIFVYGMKNFPTAPPSPGTPPPVCGNGILDGGEQCDDGNLVNNDGCDNNCTFSPPPPPPTYCSPGYWKNHPEVWMGEGCSAIDDQTLLDMLSPQGSLGTAADRIAAAYILNNCSALEPNCNDD